MKKFYFLLLTIILFLTVTKQVFSDDKNIFPKKKPILVPEIKEKKVIKTINDICEYPEGIDISYNENLIVVACWFEETILFKKSTNDVFFELNLSPKYIIGLLVSEINLNFLSLISFLTNSKLKFFISSNLIFSYPVK